MKKKLLFILTLVVFAVVAAFVFLRGAVEDVNTAACPSKDTPRVFALNIDGSSNEKLLDKGVRLLDSRLTVRYPSTGYFGVPMRIYTERSRDNSAELILDENVNDVQGCGYASLLVNIQKDSVQQTLQELASAAHTANQELQYDTNNPVKTASGITYVMGTSSGDTGVIYHRALGLKDGYPIFVSFQHNGTLASLADGKSSEDAVFRTILETIIFE